MKRQPRVFPLENILTVSAREYVESVGKNLVDYHMVGVHSYTSINDRGDKSSDVYDEIREDISKKVPDAEVVVGFKTELLRDNGLGKIIAQGTALVLKTGGGTGTGR